MNRYEREQWEELKRITKSVAQGAPITLDVCNRILGSCSGEERVPREMLDTLVVVSSELDDVPGPAQRALWNRELYDRKQRKAAEYLRILRPALLAEIRALHEFLEQLEGSGDDSDVQRDDEVGAPARIAAEPVELEPAHIPTTPSHADIESNDMDPTRALEDPTDACSRARPLAEDHGAESVALPQPVRSSLVSVQRAAQATWLVALLLVSNAVARDMPVDWIEGRDSLFGNIQLSLTLLFVLAWGVSAAKWSAGDAGGRGVPAWCKVSIAVTGVLILGFVVAMMRFVFGG